MPQRRVEHLELQPRCGACADTVFTHERVVALLGDNGWAYSRRTERFAFPPPGMNETMVDGYRLCRYPQCTTCSRSPEVVPIHEECFEVFRQTCASASALDERETLSRLWTVGAWRSPWRKADLVHVVRDEPVDGDALARIAAVCGVVELCAMPTEIVLSVRRWSAHAPFWRAVDVVALANRVSAATAENTTALSLKYIESWQRGGRLERRALPPPAPAEPVEEDLEALGVRAGAGYFAKVFASAMAAEAPREPAVPQPRQVIRLTIDLDGIGRVERLPDVPTYRGETSDKQVFVVEGAHNMEDFEVHIKDGRLRLIERYVPPQFQVWNTPEPPSGEDCVMFLAGTVKAPLFHNANHVIELDKISGLTFFFASGVIYGIHAHPREESSALSTFSRLPKVRQPDMVWLYVPISRADRVVVFGARERSWGVGILLRMSLVGDIVLGEQDAPVVNDYTLSTKPPVAVVYGEPRHGQPVSVLGALRREQDTEHPPPDFCRKQPVQLLLRKYGSVYFSWASLAEVSSAQVFYDRQTGLCRGVIFRYNNGGLRAVGECHVLFDSSRSFTRPSRICFQQQVHLVKELNREREVYRAVVEFGGDAHGGHDGEGWECHELDGFLRFWFTTSSSYLAVTEEALS